MTPEEEKKYLAVADEELATFMILEFDSGLRPDEAYALRWENVNWGNGKHGSIFVGNGKTPAARRVVPMSPRFQFVLEHRWEQSGSPSEGWGLAITDEKWALRAILRNPLWPRRSQR